MPFECFAVELLARVWQLHLEDYARDSGFDPCFHFSTGNQDFGSHRNDWLVRHGLKNGSDHYLWDGKTGQVITFVVTLN